MLNFLTTLLGNFEYFSLAWRYLSKLPWYIITIIVIVSLILVSALFPDASLKAMELSWCGLKFQKQCQYVRDWRINYDFGSDIEFSGFHVNDNQQAQSWSTRCEERFQDKSLQAMIFSLRRVDKRKGVIAVDWSIDTHPPLKMFPYIHIISVKNSIPGIQNDYKNSILGTCFKENNSTVEVILCVKQDIHVKMPKNTSLSYFLDISIGNRYPDNNKCPYY
ncbi:MAG: hypothetical protein ETSY2_39555 [Candidatus Entotheonella gemina]|uniref:Uncharacterized protein n=1 Tax=Candidatus Entotheonella gemina TaxID=1429439 RepID=W4LS15_9BACT|nr:MAG: hypothetical protein ETSY2_39555 [Candidatus Entotheonella gemina]